MAKMVAFCGIICTDCEAFIATQEDDDVKRRDVAETWSKAYGLEIKPEEINCDGCLNRGPRVFSYCNICEIRKCGQERNVENCAYCDDYECEKLTGLFERAPEARKTLEEIRQRLNK